MLKSGNIFDALTLAMRAKKKTPFEIIEEIVGSVMYLYYLFVDGLHTRPIDIDDMTDGLLYLQARNRLRDEDGE